MHRSTWSDTAGWQDNLALVVVRAVQIRLRRGGPIRYHQVVLFESARGDDCTRELRRMAAHVDALCVVFPGMAGARVVPVSIAACGGALALAGFKAAFR